MASSSALVPLPCATLSMRPGERGDRRSSAAPSVRATLAARARASLGVSPTLTIRDRGVAMGETAALPPGTLSSTLGRSDQIEGLARRIGGAHAHASRIAERAAAHFDGENVVTDRRVDLGGKSIEHETAVFLVAFAGVHAVPDEAHGARRGHLDHEGAALLGRDLGREVRAALLAWMDHEVERHAARRGALARHCPPSDLVCAPRIGRLAGRPTRHPASRALLCA